MARTDAPRSHRSKKKRITLVLAPVAALAIAVPLMSYAGAATPNEVSADCKSNSDKLSSCDFIDVAFKENSFGPNERVSTELNNCENTAPARKSATITAASTRTIQFEDGTTADGSFGLGDSVLQIGLKYASTVTNITGTDEGHSVTITKSDEVKANHIGVYMWSAKRLDVSGYLKATYKDEQDGQRVFFSPSEGGNTHHVFYPQILTNGSPDGRLWLRNIPCSSNGVLNSVAEAGFGEAGGNIVDVEVTLENS
ncbi:MULTISPECIES: hypothetical protein [unclassified Streptomyces]|uniref:hypothetical protein n=1 Tax=unclassified Streptomyces TaxID=2593676 RepID=UPI003800F014